MKNDDSKKPESQYVFFSHEMVRGVPVVISSKIALAFIQFGITVVIVNYLGKHEYGILSACQVIAAFAVVICSMGLNIALVRFVPELAAEKNKAGLIRLVVRVAGVQGAMVLAAAGLIWIFKPQFDDLYFKFDSHYLLLLVILLVGIRLARMVVEDTFTALFKMGSVAVLSLVQSTAWLLLALMLLRAYPTASIALAVAVVAAATFPIIGAAWLFVYLRRLKWTSPPYGIGKRRVLGLSLAQLFNTLALMMLQQYSAVFFLTVFRTPAEAGVFRLGFETTLLAILFIPMATQKVFAAGFADAYARDEHCLGGLVSALYRALIIIVIPLACFGVFFAPRGFVLIYGDQMAEAGAIASLFCVYHAVSLVWVPLSLAVVAREKILATAPIQAFQVAVNLVLNILLIPRFGIYGGVAAMVLTLVLAAPIQLRIVAGIAGGIFFPLGFFARITVPLVIVVALLSPLAPYLNLIGFFALSIAYLALYPFMIRKLGLLREEDVSELRAMNFSWLNRALNLVIAQSDD